MMLRVPSRWIALFTIVSGIPVFLLYYLATSSHPVYDIDIITSPSSLNRKLEESERYIQVLKRKLQESKELYRTSSKCADKVPECQIIHVCFVCAGHSAARDVTTVIKSLLFFRRHPLHLHIIVDDLSLPVLRQLFATWAVPDLRHTFYSTSKVKDDVSWIPNQHYSGIFGLMKLQMPYLLPTDLQQVILLDTDVTLAADISELWRLFEHFNKGQYLGLVENLSDWYLPTSQLKAWPAMGRGYNTGVMLMRLDVMRSSNWYELWWQVTHKYLPTMGPTKLADQDVINAIIRDNPDIVYVLPCTWNVQISNRALFNEDCYSTSNAKAVHFNSPEKYQVDYGSPEKNVISDFYKSLYFMFLQYDGHLLKHPLTTPCLVEPSNNFTETQSTISDLIKQSPEISEACYQLEGLRQSSRGRLHLYYLPYNYTAPAGDVTLVTQLSIDRLQVLEMLCDYWQGPMSLALYLNDNEARQFHDFVINSPIISSRSNIGFHILFKTGAHYPVNYLRNIALNNAKSDFVFLTDIDFLPMRSLHSYLKDAAAQHRLLGQKKVLIVPAFETQQYQLRFPSTKEELLQFMDSGLITMFRHDIWAAGHSPTDYTQWRNISTPYLVTWQPNYEPYVVADRHMVPPYDERFFGFGWNKVSHIMELDALGFSFLVLPNAFIIHAPHAPSLDISKFRASPVYRRCLTTLKMEFQKDLSRKYGIRALKYLSNE